MQVNTTELRRLLTTRFNEGELRDLCADLGIDYESLPGDGKADKARELVAYFERRGRIIELDTASRRLRPNSGWSNVEALSLADNPAYVNRMRLPPKILIPLFACVCVLLGIGIILGVQEIRDYNLQHRVLYQDDFGDHRPEPGQQIKQTTGVSLTTSVIGGQFIVKVDNMYVTYIKVGTDVYDDFDATVNIAEIDGDIIAIDMPFRVFNDKWGNKIGYRFYVFPSKQSKAWVIRPINDVGDNMIYGDEDIDQVRSMRVVCKSDTCAFYINDRQVVKDTGFYAGPGNILLDVNGKGTVRFDSIIIRTPE